MEWVRLPQLNLPEPTIPKGVWDGSWLGGTGINRVLTERAFERWCKRRGHLCIRTVDLFWYLSYQPRDLPRFDKETLKAIWRYQMQRSRLLLKHGLEQGIWVAEGNRWRKMKPKEVRQWIQKWMPGHPGRWDFYYKQSKRYYSACISRYKWTLKLWSSYPVSAKRAILRCSRYSNRIPEAHPDYYVVFQVRGRERPAHGFVEVKRFRESIRPSQQRFFPELVNNNSQRIWIVRIEPHGRKLHWYRIGASGPNRILESPVG